MSQQPYRVPAPRPDLYAAAWARLRKRRIVRRLAVGLTGYALGTVIAGALTTSDWTSGTRAHGLGMNNFMMGFGLALGVVLLGLTAVLARYLLPFVCPRCDQPFFRGATEIGFTKNCVACGIAVGTPMPVTEDDEGPPSPHVNPSGHAVTTAKCVD